MKKLLIVIIGFIIISSMPSCTAVKTTTTDVKRELMYDNMDMFYKSLSLRDHRLSMELLDMIKEQQKQITENEK